MVGTSECEVAVVADLVTTNPDVILIDVAAPDSLPVVQSFRCLAPDAALIAFAVDEREPNVVKLAEACVRGWVTCGQSIHDLTATVMRVARGEIVYPPRLVSMLLCELSARGRGRPAAGIVPVLTAREQQILDLIARHLSNKEIGQLLNISEATVKSHVHNLLEKLHVSRRSEAAARLPFPKRA